MHDKRIAYIKEDSTIEIRDPKQDNKVVASSKPYCNFQSVTPFFKSIFCELSNGNLITNFYTDEFVVFTIDKDSISQVGVIKNVKAEYKKELIPLSKNRFGVFKSKVLSIWKGDVPFQNEPLKSIEFDLSIERVLQLEGKEILVVRFDKLIKLVNLEDYSIMYSFDCPNINGEVFFQYDEDRLVDNKYLINIKTKTFDNLLSSETLDYDFKNGIKLSNGYLYIQAYHNYETGYSYDSAPYLFVIDVNTKKSKKVNHSQNGQMNTIDEHTFVKLKQDKSEINTIDYCSY